MHTLRIYGDSIMKGVIYNENSKQTYNIAKNATHKTLADYGIEVKNNSRMGTTIDNGFAYLQRTLPDCDENTLVLLEFGGNDCNYNWSEISKNPQGTFQPKVAELKFIEYYRKAIEFVRSKGATVAIATLVPINSQKYMNFLSRNLNYNNILNWLGDVSMLGRWQEHYNGLVQCIAYSMDCPIIDVRSDFLTSHDYSKLICEDGIHPTQLGHNKIEASLISFLKKHFNIGKQSVKAI